MDVINEIIRQSAVGPLSKWYRRLVITIFSSIVFVLLTMFVALIKNASQLTISFGY